MTTRATLGLLLAGTLLGLAVPPHGLAQIDSLRINRDALRSARLAGIHLRWEAVLRRLERVHVINMIPQAQSNETNQDSEPNLAVDPTDPTRVVGSAFTPDPAGGTTLAPVFVSTDRGNTWAMRNTVPSGNGMTGDISLDFAWRGGTLYTGILRGGSGLRQMILRTADPFTGGTMTTLVDRNTNAFDQPYVAALTTAVSGSDVDRVYVGFNNFGARTGAGGTGRTASLDFSLSARTAAPPAGFTVQALEVRNTFAQDMPAIRFSAHPSGVIYGVFYRWTGGNLPNAVCDIVVVRDDNFATGATPFAALADPSDGLVGRLVVTGRAVPAFPANLGQNRLVASNLSIVVNPSNAAEVYVAWADRVGTTDYTLHVRRSTDSGATWSADLLTITNATNPALAIGSGGVAGFLYQALTGTAPSQRWETRLRRTASGTAWSDLLLATTPDNTPAPTFQPYIGDYVDLIAVNRSFYGIFSASNVPNMDNFPQGVRYQRNADFTTNQVRNLDNSANVPASIDPYFFRVEPGLVFDVCTVAPLLCQSPEFDPGILRIPVDTFPVRVVDPIPRNCTLKWNCPGCEGGLCPGFYHIYLDDLDPADWSVEVVNQRGEYVTQRVARQGTGIVVSFRPRPAEFREQDIGDYYLTFETLRSVPRGTKTFRTRIETSPYPQAVHLGRPPAR